MPPIDNGKAFEYACLICLEKAINNLGTNVSASILRSSSVEVAENNYNILNQSDSEHTTSLMSAGKKFAEIMLEVEPKLATLEQSFSSNVVLTLQPDSAGISGDVRDMIAIKTKTDNSIWEIGVSCKHNHNAVKHPRISLNINFGELWFGYSLSRQDFSAIKVIFDQIDDELAIGHTKWNEVQEKAHRYYLPLLQLIIEKIIGHPDKALLAEHLLRYLLGNNDFYKLIYTNGKTVQLLGFNLNGSLNKPADTNHPSLTVNRLHFPTRIINCGFKPGSDNTIEIFFDRGWQISMRLHSASTNLEKSLKMDARLVGMPTDLFSHSRNIE